MERAKLALKIYLWIILIAFVTLTGGSVKPLWEQGGASRVFSMAGLRVCGDNALKALIWPVTLVRGIAG